MKPITAKTADRILIAAAAGILALAFLPPRCAESARATEAAEAAEATELEPIVVTPLYVYPSDRQLARLAARIPELGIADARPAELLEQLSDFFAARADPNDLPAREIEWLTSP